MTLAPPTLEATMNDIPLEYLLDTSRNTLGEYQLLHMKRASEVEKQMRDLLRLYVDEMAAAGFALYLREHREAIFKHCTSVTVVPRLEN